MRLNDVANEIIDMVRAGEIKLAHEQASKVTVTEYKTYLWGQLPSDVRSALKKAA